jgi:seryl-tRNA(Sec) selenium transferase
LDGTIQKEGQRHTVFGIEFQEEDIAALHDAFQRYQKNRVQEMEARVAELSDDVKLLETGLKKLGNLLTQHQKKAPSPIALIEAAKKIANHFRWGFKRRQPIDLGWIKWKDI